MPSMELARSGIDKADLVFQPEQHPHAPILARCDLIQSVGSAHLDHSFAGNAVALEIFQRGISQSLRARLTHERQGEGSKKRDCRQADLFAREYWMGADNTSLKKEHVIRPAGQLAQLSRKDARTMCKKPTLADALGVADALVTNGSNLRFCCTVPPILHVGGGRGDVLPAFDSAPGLLLVTCPRRAGDALIDPEAAEGSAMAGWLLRLAPRSPREYPDADSRGPG